MTQTELFNEDGSPTPGMTDAQRVSASCSAEALDKVDAARLERLTEQEFLLYPAGATADEIVYRLQLLGLKVDYLSIRPRVSELKARRVLVPTGERRRNRKNNTCSVLIHRQFVKEA